MFTAPPVQMQAPVAEHGQMAAPGQLLLSLGAPVSVVSGACAEISALLF